MVMLLCDNYNHKLFGLIPSEEAAILCGKPMASSSPEPKGTLTPPGSSPLGGDCAHIPHFTQSSDPPSPETPMTPDSAHMTMEPPPTNQAEVFSTELSNQEPLIGARKRKASKVHKLEPECITRTEGDAIPPPPTLTCNVCQAEMKSQHDFTRHIRTHNRIVEDDASGTKLFECGLCQKQLSSNSSLDRHMLVHSGERPFRCHICGTHFTTNGNMHRHIRGHYRNGGGGSDTGDSDGGSDGGAASPRKRRIDFDDEGPLGKIARLQSGNYSADDEFSASVEDLSCPICGAEQSGVSALEVHLEKEHPERSLSLKASSSKDLPEKTESSNFSTNITVIKMQEKGERVIEGLGNGIHHCPTCGLPFPSVESWLLHLRDHPTLKCNSCDTSFESISEYTVHKRQDACGHRNNLSVSLFDRQTSPPRSIFPRNLHFPLSSQPLSLTTPNPLKKGFLGSGSPISLTRHPPLSHHPHSPLSLPNPTTSSLSHDEQFARDYKDMKLNGQYPCRLCKEVYANLRKLKSHNLVHMVAPPYQCNLCSFVSNDKNTLKEHMKNHKGDTPYECTLCSLSFTTKANCERHIKNIHGRQTREEVKRCMTYTPQDEGPASQETSRETICRLCKFDCKSRSVLRDHMRSSHPEGVDKPFKCKICQLAFQCSSDAYRHIIQAHQEAVSSESLETLVEQRTRRDEHHDLSPVESLLSFSKFSLPMSSSKPNVQQNSPASHIVSSESLTLHKVPPFPTPSSLVSPPMLLSTYTPPAIIPDDVPLDLSMNKRKRTENAGEDADYSSGSDDEEITIIDEEEKDGSVYKSENDENLNQDVIDPKSRHASSPHSEKTPHKSNFPLVYPGQLPVQFLPFQGQYPFLMNPFSALPPVANLQLFEQYQEIKRGLQLTSGGTLLSPENNSGLIPSVCSNLLNHSSNRFIKSTNSSFQLSAMSLTVPKSEQQSDENDKSEGRSQLLATDLSSNREGDEMSHFTMRNSVLVKKPKQRRYRTERPWRCDLCDKGFTLRSNMERHMKQQHPDLWQQRLRGTPSHQRLGVNSNLSRDLFGQTSVDIPKLLLKSDTEEVTSETTDGGKEDEESELIIDDEEDEEGNENSNKDEYKKEDGGTDLASVQKLLSTASSQSFSFFHREAEESDKNEENSSPCVSPLSQDASSEEGKKSAYSSAPQKQKCPFCHRKFPWSSSLVRHIRTHTGQKPYLCPVCHFPFTTKSNCDRHLQRKHPNSPQAITGDRPYRCARCPGAAFTSIESLRKHDMFKHEKANDTSLIPIRDDLKYLGTGAFWCYLCDVRYCSSKEVLQHIAESHPEGYRSLRIQDIPSESPPSPPSQNNNSSENEQDSSSITSEWVLCMVCYHKASTVEDLKEHILSSHTRPLKEQNFSSTSSEDPNDDDEEEEEEEEKELSEEMDERSERETSEFISNMLGTKPAVIDHLLSSKSTADAAKLLGVR